MQAGQVIRGLMLCGALAAPPTLLAQEPPVEQPSADRTAAPAPQNKKQTNEKTPPPSPDSKPAPPTREFKPSEAVSSDQEVDFPADL